MNELHGMQEALADATGSIKRFNQQLNALGPIAARMMRVPPAGRDDWSAADRPTRYVIQEEP